MKPIYDEIKKFLNNIQKAYLNLSIKDFLQVDYYSYPSTKYLGFEF